MQRNFAPGMGSGEAPWLVRLGGKLVLEILPAALASAIGAFLFAQYQFDRGAVGGQVVTPAVVVPASAEMLQLVREEHAMIQDFLTAQRTAEQDRAVAVNADAQADATRGADLAAAVPVEADPMSAGKAATRHKRTIVAASGTPESAAAALPPIRIAAARPAAATAHVLIASTGPDTAAPGVTQATAQPGAGLWPPAPQPPAHPSLVAETLAVPGHVVSVTLHAVMAIGGIPSWLGHRFGDNDAGAGVLPYSSAS